MGRKRRRRSRRNPIRRIFALVCKFLRNLQEPSLVPKKRRRRRRKKRKNLIRRIFALGSNFFSDRQKSSINPTKTGKKRSMRIHKRRKFGKRAILKIVSDVRDVTITRIQK